MANMLLFIGGIGLIELIIALAYFVLWLYTIIQIVTKQFRSSYHKAFWLLIVLAFPVLGLLLYYAFGRGQIVKSRV
jgi:Phospholipase_D-nuclease N-terminal